MPPVTTHPLTPAHTHHRHRISEQNSKVQGLAKSIKERVTALSADRGALSEAQAAKTRKLLQDFAAILQVGVERGGWRQQEWTGQRAHAAGRVAEGFVRSGHPCMASSHQP